MVLMCCQLKPVAAAVSCLSEDLGDAFSLARMKGCWDFSCAVFFCMSEGLWKCLDAVWQFPHCDFCPANGLASTSGKKEFRMGSVLPVWGAPVFLMDCFASCFSCPCVLLGLTSWTAEDTWSSRDCSFPFPQLWLLSVFLGVAEGVKDIKACENGDGVLCWWDHWPAVSFIRVQRQSCGRRICRCSVQGWKWLLKERKKKVCSSRD